jgi:Alpha/beta hydrolase family
VRVLLVHGLWRTPLSLRSLARQLRLWGFETELFGYAAIVERYDRIVLRLQRRIERLASSGEYAIVTHSLGAVLARAALARVRGPRPRRVVMLAPPNQPPKMAATLARLPPYRWLLGESGANLARPEFYAGLPSLADRYSIIAGTAGPRRPGLPLGTAVNDGLVTLQETRIGPDDVVLALPAGHTFIMRHPEVQAMIRWLLLSGMVTPVTT